jgi:hypothetical protein
MTTKLLEAALRYAERGWPVFPCEPRGKRPRTRSGLHDDTTDRQRIEQWCGRTATQTSRCAPGKCPGSSSSTLTEMPAPTP